MPLIWNERSFAAVVSGVSLKQLQVQQSMPSYDDKEDIHVDVFSYDIDPSPTHQQTVHSSTQQQFDFDNDCASVISLPLTPRSYSEYEFDNFNAEQEDSLIDNDESVDADEGEDEEEYVEDEDEADSYSFDFYEQQESRLGSQRVVSSPRKPLTRISALARAAIASNLRILSHSCNSTTAACNRSQTRKQAAQAPKRWKVTSPFGKNQTQQDDLLLKKGNQQAQLVRNAFKHSNSVAPLHTKPTPPAAPATSRPSLSKSQARGFISTRHTTSHLRSVCARGNERWAKVLNQRLLVKSMIKERQAFQSRREQFNNSFAKNSSSVMRSIHRKHQQAKADQRLMTSKVLAARSWIVAYQFQQSQSQIADSTSTPTTQAVSSPSKRWLKRQPFSICDVPRRTLLRSFTPRLNSRASAGSFETFRRNFFFRNREQIEGCFNGSTCHTIQGVSCVQVNESVKDAFMAKRFELAEEHPAMTFHGTRMENITSISQHGFLIPNKTYANGMRIKVANGSVFGVGIYSAVSAQYSVSLARGAPVFICAVLQSNADRSNKTTRPTVDAYVVFEEARIVPLFLLHYSEHYNNTPDNTASSFRSLLRQEYNKHTRTIKCVPVSMLRQILHKKYAIVRMNSALTKKMSLE